MTYLPYSWVITFASMLLIACDPVYASEVREVPYSYGPQWLVINTHVICNDCPPISPIKPYPSFVKLKHIKIMAPHNAHFVEQAEGTELKLKTDMRKDSDTSQDKGTQPVSYCNVSENNHTVYFELDSSDIPSSELLRLRKSLINYSGKKVSLIGYTCDLGSNTHNLELANKRVRSVAEAILSRGHKPSKVIEEPKGECCFTGLEREYDRRVEIVIQETE